MPISLALGETKSNISLANESKSNDITWDDANWTWDGRQEPGTGQGWFYLKNLRAIFL